MPTLANPAVVVLKDRLVLCPSVRCRLVLSSDFARRTVVLTHSSRLSLRFAVGTRAELGNGQQAERFPLRPSGMIRRHQALL